MKEEKKMKINKAENGKNYSKGRNNFRRKPKKRKG